MRKVLREAFIDAIHENFTYEDSHGRVSVMVDDLLEHGFGPAVERGTFATALDFHA